MAVMNIDFGILMETKITGDIYTQFSSSYSVFASDAVSIQQGGIAFFWISNKGKIGHLYSLLKSATEISHHHQSPFHLLPGEIF
jgi:hypothetical protein